MFDQPYVLIIDDGTPLPCLDVLTPAFVVRHAGNRAQALAVLDKHPRMAIALINLESSVTESHAVLTALRSRRGTNSAVIAVSIAREDRGGVKTVTSAGADEIMFRPFDETVIRVQMQKLLRLHSGLTNTLQQQRSNQLYAMLDTLTTGVCIFEYISNKIRALYVNETFRTWTMLLPGGADVSADDMLSVLPVPQAAIIQTAIHDNLHSGVPIDTVFQAPTQAGNPLAFRLRALPMHYEGHETPVYLANLTDITSQYMIEEALKESKLTLASLMNAVPGGIAVYDLSAEPRIVYHNDVLRTMCGYTAEEYDQIMLTDFRRLIDPHDQAMVVGLLESYRKKPRPLETVFRIQTKQGVTRWMHLSVSPLGEGLLCNAVFIDITKEKENEARTDRMLSELFFRTEHDPLTGIINRETFYRKTTEMLNANRDTEYAILVMDIDRFKIVNEMFGKDVGDRILIAIAKELSHLLSHVGTFARMEADHFVACFPQKLLDMERIIRLTDIGLKRERINYRIQLSYGVYVIRNLDVPVNQMCDRAVMALKTIKGNVMKRYAFYDDQLRQTLLDENTILDEMYEALAQKQFVPYLQPVFTVDTNQPVGAEVLVRWQHPTKGLIPPGKFIPLFERNGFITKLDLAMLDQACELLATWKAIGYPLPLSVNISRIDLYYPNLCDQLLAITQQHGVSPSQLRLEITESAYSRDPEELMLSIERLRAAGFMIHMDDFGSGYSSLNVLMDMPVDTLKLDMRFMAKLNTNPRAASILTSVVRMAKWLRIPVVAEGVETTEQLNFLRSIGCDHVQGYLLAKPMSINAYTARYINPDASAVALDYPMRQNPVDLSYLWGGNPQADVMFNGMVGGMGIYELCGETLEVRRVNDGYYELFGCTPKQVFEGVQTALFTVHPEDRPGLLQVCRRAAQTGAVERCVCRHLHSRNGRQQWLEARLRHLGRAGENDVFCFTFNDVTELKEFEQSRMLRTYAMVLRSVYSSVYEFNLTHGVMRAIHTAGNPDEEAAEQPLEALQAILKQALLNPDDELENRIFTPGHLDRLLRECPNGYYLLERKLNGSNRLGCWASFTFIRVPTYASDEVYLLCIADVDSRKRADDLLTQNEWLQRKQREQERYQTLLVHLGTSLMDWDLRTNHIISSGGLEQYLFDGYDLRTLTSYKDIEHYLYNKDLGVFRMFIHNLLAHGSASVTMRVYRKDGQVVWCRILCSVISDAQGHAERCIAAISQIDEQMKIRESYLDEQTRFQAYADNFLVGLGVYSAKGEQQKIIFLSSGYRRMVGYAEDEPFFEEGASFAGVHPEDVPRFLEATQTLLRTGQPYTIEYRVTHKDGRLLWMRSRNSIVPGAEPDQARIYAVIQDITELKTLQADRHRWHQYLPVGTGWYALSSAPQALSENERMARWLSWPLAEAPPGETNPRPFRETLYRRIAQHRETGLGELREPWTLRSPTGEAARVWLFANLVVQDGQPQCYCALIDDGNPIPENE